jgi:hypothetical protein
MNEPPDWVGDRPDPLDEQHSNRKNMVTISIARKTAYWFRISSKRILTEKLERDHHR